MASMAKSEIVYAMYKKALIAELQYFYNIQVLLNDITGKLNPNTIIFVPLKFIEIRNWIVSSEAASDLDKRIHVPFWAYIICYLWYAIGRIKSFAGTMLLPVSGSFTLNSLSLAVSHTCS